MAPGVWQQGISSWRGVHAGTCYAWPLPADATCATVARQAFRDAVSEVGLEPDLLEDGILMASELAANTLHAQAVAGAGGGGNRLASVVADVEGEPMSPPARPLGLTGATATARPASPATRSLRSRPGFPRPSSGCTCAASAPAASWSARSSTATAAGETAPPRQPGRARPVRGRRAGRGLQIVHELSGGRWGHHPTRARLDSWGLRGKAVWFAVPAPLAHARLVDVTGLHSYTFSADVTAARASDRLSARQAARELEAMLDERGFGRGLVRDDQPDLRPVDPVGPAAA